MRGIEIERDIYGLKYKSWEMRDQVTARKDITILPVYRTRLWMSCFGAILNAEMDAAAYDLKVQTPRFWAVN
jgi:hypothetical protein